MKKPVTSVLFRRSDGHESYVVAFPMVPGKYYFTGGEACTGAEPGAVELQEMVEFAKRRAKELGWRGRVIKVNFMRDSSDIIYHPDHVNF
jgi:hypothetical protein